MDENKIVIPTVEIIDLSLLSVDKNNPNVMTKTQREALWEGMKKFGVIVPIITNSELVIADGQTRWEVLTEHGISKGPVVKLPITDVDRRILRQVLNKLKGSHDSVLDDSEYKVIFEQNQFGELQKLLGESDKKLVQFMARIEKGGLNEDSLDVDSARANPAYKIESGEVWQLGDHRLLCGDSTKPEDVDTLMNAEKASLVFTDPPYGVDYSEKNAFLNEADGGARIEKVMENDNIENYQAFFENVLRILSLHLTEKNSVYITMAYTKLKDLLIAMELNGFKFSQLLVWVKNNHVLGRTDYANKHELIVYGWLGTHKYYGGFDTTVWEINKPLKNDLHPTMKPIELMEKAIRNSSLKHEIVLDIFGGSGSTLIACEKLNRKCFMMELDPVYCSVIIERWEKVTGLKAKKQQSDVKGGAVNATVKQRRSR